MKSIQPDYDQILVPDVATVKSLKDQVDRGSRRFWSKRGYTPATDYRTMHSNTVRAALFRKQHKLAALNSGDEEPHWDGE
jgi:hypothetical protein